MTYKEKYESEQDWKKKILILDSFHCLMVIKHPRWNMINTALSMDLAVSTVSENLRLAQAIHCGLVAKSRNDGMRQIRKRRNGT